MSLVKVKKMGRKRKAQVNCPSNASESSNSSGSLNGLQRTAANDRERTRMRVLSKAFVRLKTSLPWVPTDTKLSKLDTLKLASAYISYLTKILDDDDNDNLNGDGKEMDFNPSSFIPPSLSSNRLVSTFKPPSLDRNKNIIEHLCNNNSINTNNRNGFVS